MKVIYSIFNVISGKRYIGSTNNYYRRRNEHLSVLRNNRHHSPYLQNSFNKHGESSFKFIILENVDDKELLIEREQWWLDNTPCEYNARKVADSNRGTPMSLETKDKISVAKKEYYRNGGKHGMKNRTHSDEVKAILSKVNTNKIVSKETGDKISQALKLKKHTAKPIKQYDKDMNLIKEWESISDACDSLKITNSSISNCLSGRANTAGGYKWSL